MIEPGWHIGSTPADVDACMNKAHIIVTDYWIYCRLACSPNTDLVPRTRWPTLEKPDLFMLEAADMLKRHKKDQSYLPLGYEADRDWYIALLLPLE